MFQPMLRNEINGKIFILSNEFEAEGCTGCAFERDPIACHNAPDLRNEGMPCCSMEGYIWVETNLVSH